MQAFVKKPSDVEAGLDFDRKLYIARRVFEQSTDNTYVVSLSSRTVVYKGCFLWDSCCCSLQIYKVKNTSLRLRWFIPDFLLIRIRVGKEHIQTGLLFIMGKSILYVVM